MTNPARFTEEELADFEKDWHAGEQVSGTIARWSQQVHRLIETVKALNEEIMGYQVRDGYDKGYEHGQSAAVAEVLRLREQNDGLYQATLMLGKERNELRAKLNDTNWPNLHAECDARYERARSEIERAERHASNDWSRIAGQERGER